MYFYFLGVAATPKARFGRTGGYGGGGGGGGGGSAGENFFLQKPVFNPNAAAIDQVSII